MQSTYNIECPKCGHQIDVQDILYHQVDEALKKQYAEELAKKETFYREQQEALELQKHMLAAEKKQQDYFFAQRIEAEKKAIRQHEKKRAEEEQSTRLQALEQELLAKSAQVQDFNKAKADVARLEREKSEQKMAIEAELNLRFNQKLQTEQVTLRNKLTQELHHESSGQLAILQQEITEKSNQLKEFKQAKVEIERLKREKEELHDSLVLEKEREFSEKLRDEKLKIQKQVDETSHLKVKELQMQLMEEKLQRDTQNKLIEEMKRKAEQGSMQLQGEAQEIAIEEWLRDNFRFDEIKEIKKGQMGADCLQIVKNQFGQICGTLYYESKRTKNFSNEWIEKFKNDIRDKNANIGVLVTETMPKEMERMGLKEGVWICTFEEFKGLSAVLRQSVIQLNEAKASQENKGEKMQLLYDYLISNEFKLQVEGIVEGFNQMRQDLEKEKSAMTSIWKKREKQLDKVSLNTINMHGSIKGIAGSAIQTVALLELNPNEI